MLTCEFLDPEQILAKFKQQVFEKHHITLPDDDPFCLEIELMVSLCGLVNQQQLKLTNQFNHNISNQTLQWAKKEEAVWNDYSQKCEQLLSEFSNNAKTIYHNSMIDAINHAQTQKSPVMEQLRTEIKQYVNRLDKKYSLVLYFLIANLMLSACLILKQLL